MNAAAKIERADNVHARLSHARQLFHATELKKSGHNTFAKYRYFELGDFLIPALSIFDQVGLSGVISFTADVAKMTICNVDAPEETIEITSPMGSAQLKACHEVQNIGAVETYQRRYLWTTALEIVEHDALEATTGRQEGQSQGDDQGEASPPASYDFPDGPATGITQLKQMVRELWREVAGCGDDGELIGLLEAIENKAVMAQCEALEHPAHRQIWEGNGKDNPGLSGFISKRKEEFKVRDMNAISGGQFQQKEHA